MEPNQPQGQQIRIEIDDAVADGTYANLSFISANSAEFIVDFARFLPGNTRGKVISRIVLTPAHALALFKSLKNAVETTKNSSAPSKARPLIKISVSTSVNPAIKKNKKNRKREFLVRFLF